MLTTIQRRAWILLPALLLLLPALAACDSGGGPPTMAPDAVLSKAATAMAALKSFHFSLSTSKVSQAPTSLYVTTAEGDAVRPGKLQATATALLVNMPVQVSLIAIGNDQYMTDPLSKRWQRIPPSFNALALLDPGKAASDILQSIGSPVADGSETIAGVVCYRIKGTVPPESMRSLSPEITAKDPLAAVLWIGSSDFLVRQVQATGALLKGEPATVVRTLTFSAFDQPVDIQPPPGQ